MSSGSNSSQQLDLLSQLVNTANARPGTMRSSLEEPCPHPLGSRSEAYRGSLHKPHQNRGRPPVGDPHCTPRLRGSTCTSGEKFSECFAHKIDQMQARLPAAGAACACGGPTSAGHQRLGVRGRPLSAPPPPKPVREDKSPKSTDWAFKEDECLPKSAPRGKVSTQMQPERRPGSGRRGPESSGLQARVQPVAPAARAQEAALPGSPTRLVLSLEAQGTV
ncbi:uncharacterized protein LOC116809530 [Hylobates moloch]|uniref:uncharacterized protein LOC116809530 n=1 Tax=Hylobates moloch TaxID=81572 RepID=UPI0013F293FA|nr:uncharacterized protein LOC116809530 [Hylobates moloch]